MYHVLRMAETLHGYVITDAFILFYKMSYCEACLQQSPH